MKLKTLKDIEFTEDTGGCYECGISEGLLYDRIKQEAIKWHKDIEASQPYEELSGPEAVQMWIKIFFNLTEEDLMTNEEINALEHGEVGNN